MDTRKVCRRSGVALVLLVMLCACTRAKPNLPTPVAPTAVLANTPEGQPASVPATLPTATSTGSTAVALPMPGTWVAPDAAVCAELATETGNKLSVVATSEPAEFRDPISEGTGTSCQIVATGTGVNFQDPWSVAISLKQMLITLGWHEDVRYVADGPMGTAAGFRKDLVLCVLYVGWRPADDVQVDRDQPVSEWNLKPEQKIFTIRLHCATQSATPKP